MSLCEYLYNNRKFGSFLYKSSNPANLPQSQTLRCSDFCRNPKSCLSDSISMFSVKVCDVTVRKRMANGLELVWFFCYNSHSPNHLYIVTVPLSIPNHYCINLHMYTVMNGSGAIWASISFPRILWHIDCRSNSTT